MRKELGKALRRAFAARMREVAADFREARPKSIYLGPGERAWCRFVDERVLCWIVLCPSPKDYDQFTILVGWSTMRRYPELSVIPSMTAPTPQRDEFGLDEYLIRLPQLWTPEDRWWVVRRFRAPRTVEEMQASLQPISDDQARTLVAPVVEDAVNRLVEQGIPYLESYAEHALRGRSRV